MTTILPIMVYLTFLTFFSVYSYLAWFRSYELQQFLIKIYGRGVFGKLYGDWVRSEGYRWFLRLMSTGFLLIILAIGVVAIFDYFTLR